jgi:hypothetical protein
MTAYEQIITHLPIATRTQALGLAPITCLADRADTLNDALNGCFVFDNTPQGADYWTAAIEKYSTLK